MYKLDSHDFLKISRCYGLVGFKINNGYRFYGNLRLNHTYNNICLKNKLYISMTVSHNFPEVLPTVVDIENKIDDKFHKDENNVLCLACNAEIILKLKLEKKCTIYHFIDCFLLPYLYSYTYYKKYSEVPFGDRSHGAKGILEFYKDFFKLDNIEDAVKLLKYMALNKYRGHDFCPCGSGKKIRNCHENMINILMTNVGN